MRRWNYSFSPLYVVGFLCFLSTAMAQVQNAPPAIAATLVIKLAAFEKTLSSGGDLQIYVLGDSKVANELQKGVGSAVGQARLARVLSGSDLPAARPSILFVGSAAKLQETVSYTRTQKILSVTAQPELVQRGVTLGVGIGNDGKPKVLLNLSSTVEENLSWNPAVMKIAKTIQ
jgi:hypothetical protein